MARPAQFVMVWGGFGDGSAGALGRVRRRRRAPGRGIPSEQLPRRARRRFPAVAMDDSGNFAVAWAGAPQDGSGYGIVAPAPSTRPASPGAPTVVVNTYTTGTQWFPKIASNGTGAFVVAWQQRGPGRRRIRHLRPPVRGRDAPRGRVRRQHVHDRRAGGRDGRGRRGRPVHGRVDGPRRPGRQLRRCLRPRVRRRGRGGRAGVPGEHVHDAGPGLSRPGRDRRRRVPRGLERPAGRDHHDGNVTGIFGRRFSAAGQPVDAEFPINTYVPAAAGVPVHGRRAPRAVSWCPGRPTCRTASGYGIAARRMLADLIFADGFESGDTSAWSSASRPTAATSPCRRPRRSTARAPACRALVDDTAGIFVVDETAGQREPLPRALLLRPERFRSRRGPRPLPHAGVPRLRGGAGAAPGRDRPAAPGRRLQPDGPRAPATTTRRRTPAFFPIRDGPHFVEIDWQRVEQRPTPNDGSLRAVDRRHVRGDADRPRQQPRARWTSCAWARSA